MRVLALAAALATFPLPAAHAFGEPGFHQVVIVPGRVAGSGRTLTVSLRDVSRPGIRCAYDHPLSGCATVDWADDPSRPKVPSDGVFRNVLVVGGRRFYLSRSGRLAARPDAYRPG